METTFIQSRCTHSLVYSQLFHLTSDPSNKCSQLFNWLGGDHMTKITYNEETLENLFSLLLEDVWLSLFWAAHSPTNTQKLSQSKPRVDINLQDGKLVGLMAISKVTHYLTLEHTYLQHSLTLSLSVCD